MRTFCAFILLGTLISAGCDGTPPSANKNAASPAPANLAQPTAPVKPSSAIEPNYKSCNPYLPLVPGSTTKYVLTYSSGIVADVTMVVDRAERNGQPVFKETTQIVDRSGGMHINQITERLYSCDGERIVVLDEKVKSTLEGIGSNSQMNYRDNSTFMVESGSLQRKGFTWTYALHPTYSADNAAPSTASEPTIVKLETVGAEDLTVPAGSFKAIKVKRSVQQNVTWDYLVKGIGLAKRETSEGTRWELKEYSGVKALD
jgi:hypothetical protein